jgi:outer membrane protein TolC
VCATVLPAQDDEAARAAAEAAGALALTGVTEQAVAADSQVRLLERTLSDQLEALGLRGYMDQITLRLSGGLSGSAERGMTADGSATLSANLDLLPQLTLTGTVSAADSWLGEDTPAAPGAADEPAASASLGLLLRPFADSTTTDREELAVKSTTLELENATLQAGYRAVMALVDAVAAEGEIDLLHEQQAVNETALANITALYERDRATDEQLHAAEATVREGARRIARTEIDAARARESLAELLDLSAATIPVPAAGALGLDGLLARAEELAAAGAGADSGATTVAELAVADPGFRRAALEVEGAALDAEAAYRFSPDLVVSASAGVPNWQYAVNIDLTLSPAQWDGNAVTEAALDLADAEDAQAYALRLAELSVTAAIHELGYALVDVQVANDDLSDAEQDLVEAQFRFERGDITALALAQAKLAVLAARNGLFSAELEVVRQLAVIDYRQW